MKFDFIEGIIVELLKPRTIFALMFYGAYIFLIAKNVNPPEGLSTIVNMLMGFYFGQRAANLNKGENK